MIRFFFNAVYAKIVTEVQQALSVPGQGRGSRVLLALTLVTGAATAAAVDVPWQALAAATGGQAEEWAPWGYSWYPAHSTPHHSSHRVVPLMTNAPGVERGSSFHTHNLQILYWVGAASAWFLWPGRAELCLPWQRLLCGGAILAPPLG